MNHSFTRTLLTALAVVAVALPASAQTGVQLPDFASGLTDTEGIIQLADGRVLVVDDAQAHLFDASTGQPLGHLTSGAYAFMNRALQLNDGRILISEFNLGHVLEFAPDGTDSSPFGTGVIQAADLEQLQDGRILVASYSGDKVHSFDPDGTVNPAFVTAINGPWGITQLADGKILITRPLDGIIESFNPDGTSNPDFATGLEDPQDVTQLADGTVLVMDGSTVRSFNPDGSENALFATGMGNADDAVQLTDGRVLVTERAREAVAAFADPSPPPTLAVSSAPVYWPLDTATLSLDAANADGLYGVRADLGYDVTRLAFVGGSLAAGTLFAGGAPQVADSDFPGTGVLELSAGRTDGNAATGDGSAATVQFGVADHPAPGPADFTLTGVDAIDPAGAPFAFDAVSGGSFMIGGVWPGDLDSDCDVDVFDLFPIGLFYNDEGPARLGDRDITWGAKAFSPWGGSSASADFAKSFADADGNGEIDVTDLFAILVNYGETHGEETGCTLPATTLVAGGPLSVGFDAPVGSMVAFDVALSAAATDLLGAGLSFDHGATGATVTAIEPGTLLAGALDAVQIGEAVAEAAFTHRGESEAVSGVGSLIRVVARIDAPDARLTMTRMAVSTVGDGTTEMDPSGGDVAVSEAGATAGEAAPAALDVALAPNPARSSAALALTSAEAGEATVEIYDALGRRVASLRQVVTTGSTRIDLPVADLAPGLYVVRAQVAGQTLSRTLTVAR